MGTVFKIILDSTRKFVGQSRPRGPRKSQVKCSGDTDGDTDCWIPLFLLHNQCGSNITEFWTYITYIEYSTRSIKSTWWYALYCTKQAGLRRPLQGTCWDDSRGDPILRQAKDYRQRHKATNQVRETTMRQRRCQERIISGCRAVCHTERIKKNWDSRRAVRTVRTLIRDLTEATRQDAYARTVIQRGRGEPIYGRESDNAGIQESAYTP
jgi:hypothetical protein